MENITANEMTQQFTNLIFKIIEMPDDKITEESVEQVLEALISSFEEGKEKMLEEASLNIRRDPVGAKQGLEELRTAADDLFEELADISENKRKLIRGIMNTLITLMEEAFERVEENYNTIVHFELVRDTQIPTYAHNTDAGADVYAPEDFVVPAHSFGVKVPVGFKMAMASGWEMQVRPRSGMSMKTQLRIANTPGTIDADYRDEVAILFDNFSDEPYYIKAGDRIAQFVISPVYRFKGLVTESVANIGNNRGGGFGSSGN